MSVEDEKTDGLGRKRWCSFLIILHEEQVEEGETILETFHFPYHPCPRDFVHSSACASEGRQIAIPCEEGDGVEQLEWETIHGVRVVGRGLRARGTLLNAGDAMSVSCCVLKGLVRACCAPFVQLRRERLPWDQKGLQEVKQTGKKSPDVRSTSLLSDEGVEVVKEASNRAPLRSEEMNEESQSYSVPAARDID